MGEIINAYIFPHPPIIIPEIGHGRESDAAKTVEGVIKASKGIASDKPSTIILVSPHAPMFKDYIYISIEKQLYGNFGSFGREDIKMQFENNLELVKRIIDKSKEKKILAGGLSDSLIERYNIEKSLDHGALVPLYYIYKRYKKFKLVHIAISGISNEELYKFGECINEAVENNADRVVFVASGDLSHRLTREAPAGFNKQGRIFDETFIDLLGKNDVAGILDMDQSMCENAGECGLRSFIIMFGAMSGKDTKTEVYSYEGPFGVGYATAKIESMGRSDKNTALDEYMDKRKQETERVREKEDSFVVLARKALEEKIINGETMSINEDISDNLLSERAGVFVSIKKNGQLRGCIGTTAPTTGSIAEEIVQNAISAGTRDPRFDEVVEDELDSLKYSVDVLSEPEDIMSEDELDVKRYGVIVIAGGRRGLLLPNLDGIESVSQQISIALQKAGINPDEKYRMQRFKVERHY